MLEHIGSVKNIPAFIAEVKSGKGEKLMGFGHRVYKSYDPRAKIVKALCDDVLKVSGMSQDMEIALELERIALSDEYFISRKLYPNVDFYTGLIYRAMHFPTDYFTVLFAIARTAGWLAQWEEMLLDKEQKIARPRQIYTGYAERPYKPTLDYKHKISEVDDVDRRDSKTRKTEDLSARPPLRQALAQSAAGDLSVCESGAVRSAYSALLHIRASGQMSQRFTRAVHTSAPSSISAWLCVQAAEPVRGSVSSAIRQIRFRSRGLFGFNRGANTRDNTRATFVSTSAARRS